MSVDLETLVHEPHSNDHRPTEPFSDLPAEQEDYTDYRTLSGVAVAGFVAGLLSLSAFLAWILSIVPLTGLLISWRALSGIRRRPDELSGRPLARAGLALSAVCLLGSWTAHTIEYMTEVPPGYDRVSYGVLQPAEGEADDAIPAAATALEGKKVFLKGYMYPGEQSRGLTEFVFVRDNGVCCFGNTTPKKTDMVLVKMAPGTTADYSLFQRKLAGTFHVERVPMGEMGEIIYHLTAEYVR